MGKSHVIPPHAHPTHLVPLQDVSPSDRFGKAVRKHNFDGRRLHIVADDVSRVDVAYDKIANGPSLFMKSIAGKEDRKHSRFHPQLNPYSTTPLHSVPVSPRRIQLGNALPPPAPERYEPMPMDVIVQHAVQRDEDISKIESLPGGLYDKLSPSRRDDVGIPYHYPPLPDFVNRGGYYTSSDAYDQNYPSYDDENDDGYSGTSFNTNNPHRVVIPPYGSTVVGFPKSMSKVHPMKPQGRVHLPPLRDKREFDPLGIKSRDPKESVIPPPPAPWKPDVHLKSCANKLVNVVEKPNRKKFFGF
eukprot:PhF_6_TR12900/c0_g1_i3/m.20315